MSQDLGPHVRLGRGVSVPDDCRISRDGSVEIGDDVVFGAGIVIGADARQGVSIGSRVWLGDGVILNPGARIGSGTIVCAASVVSDDVPADAVVAGNPARVIWTLK